MKGNHLHVYTISRFLTNIHFSYFSILTNQLCIRAKALYNILRTKNIHNKSMKFIGHPLCTGITVDIQYLEGSKSIISFTQSSSLNLYFFSLDTPRWVQNINTNSKICLCFENYLNSFKYPVGSLFIHSVQIHVQPCQYCEKLTLKIFLDLYTLTLECLY